MPFDPVKDLVPVAASARLELFLVSRSDLPFTNYTNFIKHVKTNPGKLSYGSPANGTSPHLAGEMRKSQAGVYSVHIPAPIIERLNREINRALALPNVIDVIRALGAELTPISRAEFGAVIQNDSRRYATIVKERKITE
jgi:tripartite-type tricarboxylate transporter receptor subunit TctC